jgi:hypothetical protein
VTLNPPKLSNYCNSTILTSFFFFFKLPPSHILFKKNPKQNKTKRRRRRNMLGWPNYPIGGGRPPCLAWGWFGHPQASRLVVAEPPPRPKGVVRPAWGWPNYPQAKRGGQPPPIRWFSHPNIFLLLFFFYFSFFLNKICGGGILRKQKDRIVELQQFESLGGLSVTFETFEVKVQISG